MINTEFESKPLEGFRTHTCGTCAYHLPNRKRNPSTIKKGKGKGQMAYWVCKCEGATNYNEGRVCEDGATCKHWKDRYESDESMKEWIRQIHTPKKKPKVHYNRRKPRKSKGRWEVE